MSAGPDGCFCIRGLAPGGYWIDAFADGATAGQRVVIHPGGYPQPVFLELLPTDGGFTLRGRAVFADGSPFLGMVFSTAADLVRTDADGRFRLAGLHAGEAEIVFLDGACRCKPETHGQEAGSVRAAGRRLRGLNYSIEVPGIDRNEARKCRGVPAFAPSNGLNSAVRYCR